ncbi:MAG: 3-oxoacyl-ACP reductase FabG [candidate division Zixibacteria bacterium]|nr:3-oxoacyl-ACP reductase FabG [candidate division Zixibacteria bacterium]
MQKREKPFIDLSGRVTLVTGGSRGIGRAVVEAFARAGSDVAVNFVANTTSARAACDCATAYGVTARAYKANIADHAAVKQMVADIVADFGRIDILVNNAGIWERNPIDSMSVERLQRTLNVNLLGTFYPVMEAVPRMKSQGGGCIINISSTAGQRGEDFYSPYATTKGGVIALTKSLAVELAADNIRVNCVAPGWVETDMTAEVLGDERGRAALSKIPLGRAGRPEELAGPVLFLASDLATFITGEILNVNGGAVLCG